MPAREFPESRHYYFLPLHSGRMLDHGYCIHYALFWCIRKLRFRIQRFPRDQSACEEARALLRASGDFTSRCSSWIDSPPQHSLWMASFSFVLADYSQHRAPPKVLRRLQQSILQPWPNAASAWRERRACFISGAAPVGLFRPVPARCDASGQLRGQGRPGIFGQRQTSPTLIRDQC